MGIQDDIDQAVRQSARVVGGFRKLSEIRDEDVQIAQTPKDEVFRSDRTVLSHYRPLDEKPPETGPIRKRPVLGGLHHRYFREAA